MAELKTAWLKLDDITGEGARLRMYAVNISNGLIDQNTNHKNQDLFVRFHTSETEMFLGNIAESDYKKSCKNAGNCWVKLHVLYQYF